MEFVGDALALIGALIAVAGVAIFLSVWTHRAPGNRALTMGLYLVFGGFGFFLFLFGTGTAWRNYREGASAGTDALLAISVGVIAAVTLTPQIRRPLSRLIPFDPEAWTDIIGLFLLSALGVLSIFSLAQSHTVALFTPAENGTGYPFMRGENESIIGAVTYLELIGWNAAYVGLAFIMVGYSFHRTLPQTLTRLGLELPTLRQVGVALGFVVLAFIVALISGVLLEALQPDLADEVSENLRNMTSNVDTIWGALLLGICAGVGEEILFRGAIQPRYGVIFTALIFAVMHQQYGLSMITVGVFGAGILFGILRNRTNTTCCILTHAVYNAIAVSLQQIDVDDTESARQAVHLLLTSLGLG